MRRRNGKSLRHRIDCRRFWVERAKSERKAGQTHLERQAVDLVREMLLRGESRWKTEHAGMVWVGEFRCAKSAIFCSKVPVLTVFLAFFCLKMGVCVYR